MKSERVSKILPYVFLIIVIAVLSLCFYRNQLGVCGYDWFMTWQDDSDMHIRGRIARTIETGDPFSDNGLIGQYAVINGVERYDPYFRQMGIQGLYTSFVQKITGADIGDTVRYTRMLNALLCAVMCGIISLWCYKEFGKIIGIASAVLFAFSPWLTVSARNLYWAMWLMFLPAVITLILLRRDEKKGKYCGVAAFFAALVSVFLKCGAGYEFVSCVLVCMEIPYIYYAVKNKWSFKKFITRAVVCGIGGVAGFFAAVGINLYQCTRLVGTFDRALDLMIENISKRTGAFGVEQTNELIIASLNVSPLTVVNTYLFSGEPILFGFNMFEIIAFFLVMLCIHMASGKGSRGGYIASAVSVIGPLSWMILAKGHSYIHCHINYVLWCIPTVFIATLSGIGTMGAFIKEKYEECKTKNGRIAIVAVCTVLVLYVVICFYSRGNVRGW